MVSIPIIKLSTKPSVLIYAQPELQKIVEAVAGDLVECFLIEGRQDIIITSNRPEELSFRLKEAVGNLREFLSLIPGTNTKEAKKLVEIWYNHLELIGEGLDVITFKNKRPKRPKNDNRRIAGLSAKSIAYLQDDEELVKMSVENFIYLMAKCDVDIQIKEKI